MTPLRPLEASRTSVTAPSPPQTTPSHLQQSVPFTHDALRPPLPPGTSPPRKSMRELLSCPVQELAGEAKESRTATARPKKGTDDLVYRLLLLHDEESGCMARSRNSACCSLQRGGLFGFWSPRGPWVCSAGQHGVGEEAACCFSFCCSLFVKLPQRELNRRGGKKA